MEGPDEDGWWRLELGDGDHGTDYGFIVDDDAKAYPDPRSAWQPNGVHGLSRVYDHGRFAWSGATFQAPALSSGVVYEMHVGTFTPQGTFDAAIEKLDYLVELGVTHVELMPVAAFEGKQGWGYDGVALFAVHEPYGGPDGLKRFVNAAHAKGLAVLLDVVYNHFGPSGNYTGKYGPYATDSHHTPWGGAVNLEGELSNEVRRFFCDNALMWMRDYHVDGLRLDAVHAFIDRSAIHFLEQLSSEVESLQTRLGRPLILIAESDLNDPRIVTPREGGGLGIDAQWSDELSSCAFRGSESEGKKWILCRLPGRSLNLPRRWSRHLSTTESTPAIDGGATEEKQDRCRSIAFWDTSRRMTRWAIALLVTGSATSPVWSAQKLPQQLFCWALLCPCCFKVKSGPLRRHSSILPTTPTRNWRAWFQKEGRGNSRHSDGILG